MEALAFLSLACNILQIAEMSRKTTRAKPEVSAHDASSDVEELKEAADRLSEGLLTMEQKDQEPTLQDMAVRCQTATNEHMQLLQTLRFEGSASRMRSYQIAFKAWRMESRLSSSQERIDRLSGEINTHIIRTLIPKIDRNFSDTGKDVNTLSRTLGQS